MHLQYGFAGSGNIAEGSVLQGGQPLFVPLAGLQRANGQPLGDRSVLKMGPGNEFAISVHEEHDWYSLFLPF